MSHNHNVLLLVEHIVMFVPLMFLKQAIEEENAILAHYLYKDALLHNTQDMVRFG